MNTNKVYDVVEVGVFTPKLFSTAELMAGDVGYITASIKMLLMLELGILLQNQKDQQNMHYQDIKKQYQWFIQVFIQLMELSMMN